MKKSDLEVYENAAMNVPGTILMLSLMAVCLLESIGILTLFVFCADEWLSIALCVLAVLGLMVLVLLVFLIVVSQIGDSAVAKAKNLRNELKSKGLSGKPSHKAKKE